VIFAAFGTAKPFPRLLAHLDKLAQETQVEIIAQTGRTPQTAKYCRTFDYAPSLKEYFREASLVIAHAGLGVQSELLSMGVPFVVVPRLAEYGEHNDNHQLETCEILHKRYGVLYFPDLEKLTAEFVMTPHKPYPFSTEKLQMFQENIIKVIDNGKGYSL